MGSFFVSLLLLLSFPLALQGLGGAGLAHAQTPDPAVQNQIDQVSQQISQLQQEITQLQTQLDATSKQKQTLQTAVGALDLNIKKITANVALTEKQIIQKDGQIKNLTGTIADTSGHIGDSQEQVGETLRNLNQNDSTTLALQVLAGGTLSSFFDEIATLASVRGSLEERVRDLNALKTNLTSSKNVAEQKRSELAGLRQRLNQQKQGLTVARQAQNDLLIQTKNQESNYQALLAQKKAQEMQFEQDLIQYQNKLGLSVNVSSLPPSGSAPLRWPLDNVRITQYFGNTPFATANPQIYNGHGHTGVDFAASPGTPIKAARGGVVLGTGNTDLTCPYASYGKWVFIKHDDGLSTLYAHLATFAVVQGDAVATGQVVGYSDTTGYATGPHLHFGVFASSGSEVGSFPSGAKACKGRVYTMPVADLSAYLNPLSYLPALP